MAFQMTISNSSRNPARVTLAIKDRDEIISEVRDVPLRPGDNQIDFPETYYRFSRSDYCFTVEADIQRTRSPIDMAKEFCAKRTNVGWTLSDKGIGRLYVEELEMYPDPATPGQEIRFRVRLRNDGRPMRANVRIQTGDQLVSETDNVSIPRGSAELQFPQTRYMLQGLDTCFTVLIDFERTPYPVDASRQFCAKPMGWTLRP